MKTTKEILAEARANIEAARTIAEAPAVTIPDPMVAYREHAEVVVKAEPGRDGAAEASR
jgi:hypothetical protein